MANSMSHVSWALVLRGVLGILFGIITFFVPAITLTFLVALFGAWALIDGIIAIVAAIRAPREHLRPGPFVFEGVVGILAGIGALLFPGVTVFALLAVVAAWAIITGILELVAAVRLRRVIEGEWMLALAGALSVIFGIVLLMRPHAGVLVLVLLIGAYAFAFGILLVLLGLRVRGFSRRAVV